MKKIVFLGDSITDSHRLFSENGLGDGYVYFIARELKMRGEEVRILNRGHDGFTVQGVRRFLAKDCILQKPDVVSLLVGCNDVGLMMNTGKSLKEQEFLNNYREILKELRTETDAKIICAGPFIFPWPLEYQNWIPGIREVERLEGMVAKEQNVRFLPLHEKMQQAAERYGYQKITTDGIHLTELGNQFLAKEWLKATFYCKNDHNALL